MAQGKFFFIKSNLNGLVLDIQGSGHDPGTHVITWTQRDSDTENQLWYEDRITDTIRTKMNDFCLDFDGEQLVINPYNSGSHNQKWQIAGERIQNAHNTNLALDISGENTEPGAKVVAWDYHGGDNQRWTFEYQPAQYFYIRSSMNNKVIDISGEDASPGTKAIMYPQADSPADNQLWYEDKYGSIRSKLNDFTFDSGEGCICMQPCDIENPNQGFVFSEKKIAKRNDKNSVLDISGANDDDCAELCCYGYNGQDNQHWFREYV